MSKDTTTNSFSAVAEIEARFERLKGVKLGPPETVSEAIERGPLQYVEALSNSERINGPLRIYGTHVPYEV